MIYWAQFFSLSMTMSVNSLMNRLRSTRGMKSVGDTAPAFTLPGSDGKTHTLKDLVAEKAVVIAWFPKAFTGG